MQNSNSSRLAFLDGLRLVAAGAVVVQHLFERVPGPFARALVAPGPGVFGVVLFFMISGYVIPFSVRKGFSLRSFAIRRLTRIYPLYLAALTIALLLGSIGIAPHFAHILTAGPGAWLANLMLVQDFVHARAFFPVSWTLAIEIIWYALFALLVKSTGRRAGSIIELAAPAGMMLLTTASLLLDTRIPLGRPGMIYAAVLGYQAYRHSQNEISDAAIRLNFICFLLVTLASNIVAFGVFHHPRITVAQAVGPWTLALLTFAAALYLPRLRGPSALGNPVAVAPGAMSYSIYMMHPIAIAIAFHFLPFAAVPVTLILTLIFATAGYRFVEKPGIRLGRWLADASDSAMGKPAAQH